MEIEFFVQADLKFDGKPIVREYFHAYSGDILWAENGKTRRAHDIRGMVDDGIREAHPKEYAAFAKLKEDQWDSLYKQATASPGTLIAPVLPVAEIKKEAIQPSPPKVSKSKKTPEEIVKSIDEVKE